MRKSSSQAGKTAWGNFVCCRFSLRDRLTVISSALTKLSGASEEIYLVDQYPEQISDLKRELSDTRWNVLSSCTHEESDIVINSSIVDIDKLLFDVGLTLKKLAVRAPFTHDKATFDSAFESKMIKLPKLDIPTFDGNHLHWLTFWEQYCVAINDRADLSQAQKLVYLWQSLKDGSAKNVIEGLSRSGEQYTEAVKCLQEQYNCPCLIHQAHVRKIIEVPKKYRKGTRPFTRCVATTSACSQGHGQGIVSFFHHLTYRDEAGSWYNVWVAEGKPGFCWCSPLHQVIGILESQSSGLRICFIRVQKEHKEWSSSCQAASTQQSHFFHR